MDMLNYPFCSVSLLHQRIWVEPSEILGTSVPSENWQLGLRMPRAAVRSQDIAAQVTIAQALPSVPGSGT